MYHLLVLHIACSDRHRQIRKSFLSQIKKVTGLNVDIWSAQSIEIAFKEQQIPYPRTEKGKPSFTKEFLSQHTHEIPKLIAKAREVNKINGTFINFSSLGY